MIRVQILGMVQTLARLARAGAVGELAADSAASSAADEIAEKARSLAPVDSGALRDSIAVYAEGVAIAAPYAAFVEYGTADTPAQPFVRPAIDEIPDTPARVAAGVMWGA